VKPLPMIPFDAPRPEAAGEPAPIVVDAEKTAALRPAIVDAIATVFDPEIPVNIWELGLVYDVGVEASGLAVIRMTLTAPNCPAAQSLPGEVAAKVKTVPGVTDSRVDIVWDPPWSKDRMSDAAKLQLGMW
jgi:FeS assembly SUF system protein